MLKIAKYTVYDIMRSKIVLSYALFLFMISMSLFMLDDDSSRSISSIMSVVLIVVPLISIIFSTIFIYNNADFIELLVAQPVKRSQILLADYLGMTVSLVVAFLIGVAVPVFIYAPDATGGYLVMVGTTLTLIFTSLAFFGAVTARDKARGIGVSLLLWFFFSVIYDGLLIGFMFLLSDYSLERSVLFITMFNPIDLARISLMMKMDISALMGYTGAIYRDLFGTGAGMALTFLLMLVWAVIPLIAAVRIFQKKNL
jgi:Cu-processing system permease protein